MSNQTVEEVDRCHARQLKVQVLRVSFAREANVTVATIAASPRRFSADHPVIRKGERGTCDVRMCASCKNNGGLFQPAPGVDLCRPHFKLWRDNGNKFKLSRPR